MDRAQAHTLEAFMAAILLVAGLIFASQATAVTPLSASTSNQHIENQQRTMADDLLRTATENDTLTEVIVERNISEEGFDDDLEQVFGDRQIAYNIELYWWEEDGDDRGSTQLEEMGSPSDNAVTTSQMVTIYDGDVEYNGEEEDEIYIPKVGPDPVYNVVEVRITTWKM